VIQPGDRVFFEPGENHWHGAAPTGFMAHVAIQQADDEGSFVAFGERVSDEQHRRALSRLTHQANHRDRSRCADDRRRTCPPTRRSRQGLETMATRRARGKIVISVDD
jgi:hypothetical protein